MASLEDIKRLREESGAGIVDVKKALEEAAGDLDKARDILRARGQAKAIKKADRATAEGFIGSYVHTNGKVAALVILQCETDFVARTDTFQALARDLAMHVAAMNPQCVSPADVSEAVIAHERAIWEEQVAAERKPSDISAKILEGKEKKFRADVALLSQPFVKDPDRTVEQLVKDAIAVLGENVTVGGFTRQAL